MRFIFIANFLPDSNYTRDLSQGFLQVMKKRDELYLCGRKNEPVLDGKTPKVDLVWNKGVLFFIPILIYVFKIKPNVIHFQHEFKTYGGIGSALIFPWLIGLLRLFGFKVFVTCHLIVSKNQINANFLESFGLANNILNKFLGKVFLFYVFRLIGIFSSAVTAHTEILRTRLVDEYKCDPKKVFTIAHGIRRIKDPDKLPKSMEVLRKHPVLKNKKLILIFGYFSPRKGYDYLIKEYKYFIENTKSKDFLLVLAGDVLPEFAYYKKKIEALIKTSKISKSVLITGFVNGDELDELYRLAKVCIIPAVFSYNSSGALAMTLAYKKPLIVADVKPISEEVKSNNIGLAFDISDHNSFATQLERILNDKKTIHSINKSLNNVTQERFWDVIAEKHYKLYQSI